MNRNSARRALAAIFLVAALPIAAAPGKPTPAPPPPSAFDVRVPVPDAHGAQDVNVLQREFPVGGASGWHVHPGIEIAYLLSGEMELRSEGVPPRRMKPGEHFVMSRGVRHNGINLGKVPARVMITYIVDRGAAVRTAAQSPE